MAKLFIPEIGTQLILSEDWQFMLHHEYRNTEFHKAMDFQKNEIRTKK